MKSYSIKIFLLITLLFTLSFISCNDSISPNGLSSNSIILLYEFNDRLIFKDYALIREASIQNDLLKLKVEFGGGCKIHDFKLFGLRSIIKTNPAQVEIFLSHNSNGDMCEAWIGKELLFSLTQLKIYLSNTFGKISPVILRIHEPGKSEPIIFLYYYF